MTLSPVDNFHQAIARPDLPAYELNTVNADPFNDGPAEENHHLFRRSLGPNFRDAWWVELPGGQVIPNRVGLSRESHRVITENKARIEYNLDDGLFYWREMVPGFLATPLNPQPGPHGICCGGGTGPDGQLAACKNCPDVVRAAVFDGKGFDAQLTIGGGEVPHSEVVLPPDVPCTTCKGRGRVPRKPDRVVAEHKRAPARTKAVKSLRVPKDELEDGLQVLDDLIDAHRSRWSEEMGWSSTVSDYYVVVAGLARGLQ